MRTLTPFEVIEALRRRSTEALLGQSGLSHAALAAEVRRRFDGVDISEGALLQVPIIESALPYVEADRTLDDLSGNLLHPTTVSALDLPGEPRIGRNWHPYTHQLQSWQLLGDPSPQSVLVTSGTGSGKTECFLVPLIDALAREAERTGRLAGVRAIALYPLNALIASQRERLRKWTAPFRGKIRFALYNGEMPEDDRVAAERTMPEQVVCRRTLRSDPPPILVTNITMLEYLTVRRRDRSILDGSRGMLRWIILDEAHTYTGSRAAEVALLLRRVMLAFGVAPDQVRFVATSATIGEGKEVTEDLRRFLQDVSGSQPERMHVVVGERRTPVLPDSKDRRSLVGVDFDRLEPAAGYDLLSTNPIVQEQIRSLARGPLSWAKLREELRATGAEPEAVALALARASKGEDRLLPLRMHIFHRAVPGLWTCIDSSCKSRPEGWPFGGLMHAAVERCPSCSSVVLPIIVCRSCGEPFIDARETAGHLHSPDRGAAEDEFAIDSEEESAAAPETEGDGSEPSVTIERLLATRVLTHARPVYLRPRTGEVMDSPGDGVVTFQSHDRVNPEACPACQEQVSRAQSSLLRPFRFGAPFLLSNAVPVLLEAVEPLLAVADREHTPPAEGRQLLSFTDSRQGTARFAGKLQSAAERNYIRALIYFAVQDTCRIDPAKAKEIEEIDKQIETLRGLSRAELGPTLAMLEQKRVNLVGGKNGLGWTELCSRLAHDDGVSTWIRKVWASRDERFANDITGPNHFAELLMLRELARRTKRSNSLETMGLACLRFEEIERLSPAHLPDELRIRGRSIQDWRDFLYLSLTIAARDYFAIRIEQVDAHWLQPRVPVKRLIAPNATASSKIDTRWPQIRPDNIANRGTLPRLLEVALSMDSEDRADREIINGLLEKAWFAIQPLLQVVGTASDARLDLRRASIAPIGSAWRCPVTRRVLDTTFCGYSPYGLRTGVTRGNGALAEPIDMPVHPAPFLRESGDEERISDWLVNAPAVQALRLRGLWANLHDRIALGAPYARSAEHSAQQPSSRLRRYEAEFRRGEINVLNCSTTMEMGVDIGTVSSVVMTNVPPSTANYRQRVGRAGRRRQATAIAFTYCKDTPLEREAFKAPVEFLTRPVMAPRVSLDSAPLVQRHVNAYLLSAFVREQSGDASSTKAGAFYGYPADLRTERLPDAPSRAFREWVAQPTTRGQLADGLDHIVRSTALSGSAELYDAAGAAVAKAEAEFCAEWAALQSQAVGLDRDAAKKAIGFQLKRLCDEFLLSDLANRGVLPGHGFPTAVVEFVHKDEPDGEEGLSEEGNVYRRRHYPSRNLDQAMRDYAPGVDVVVDGLVYRSAGVTLNWKRPAGAKDVHEIQSLRFFWNCEACGAADTSPALVPDCPSCGTSEGLEQSEFLRPSGFAADTSRREPAHAEIDTVEYVAPEPPFVVARGANWRALRDPKLGRLRASRDGLVFYSTSGGAGAGGYKLCLHCGRAEPENASGKSSFSEHKPMRFTKADSAGLCPGVGKPFAIKRTLLLGHDVRTDVFELQLFGLGDKGAAWALASALRTGLARQIGIEVAEMGITVQSHKTALGGVVLSIMLFDLASGGAGFSPIASDHLPRLLQQAEQLLDCKVQGCVSGCSACILTSDLRDQQDIMDRRTALSFLRERVGQLAEPTIADHIAPGTTYSDRPADEAMSTAGASEVIVWSKLPDIAVLRSGDFIPFVAALQKTGRSLALVLPSDEWTVMDEASRLALRDLALRYDIELRKGDAPRFSNGATAFLGVKRAGGTDVWASRNEAPCRLGPVWATADDTPIVRAGRLSVPAGQRIEQRELEPRPDTVFLTVSNELNGLSSSFGDRFVAITVPAITRVGLSKLGNLARIIYYDRYVKSPLPALLAVSAIAALANRLGDGSSIEFELVSEAVGGPDDTDRRPWLITHNWHEETERVAIITELCKRKNLSPTITVRRDRHARELDLILRDGSVARLVLDQGFGCWHPPSGVRLRHDFSASVAAQVERIVNLNVALEGPAEPSYLVITRGY